MVNTRVEYGSEHRSRDTQQIGPKELLNETDPCANKRCSSHPADQESDKEVVRNLVSNGTEETWENLRSETQSRWVTSKASENETAQKCAQPHLGAIEKGPPSHPGSWESIPDCIAHRHNEEGGYGVEDVDRSIEQSASGADDATGRILRVQI